MVKRMFGKRSLQQGVNLMELMVVIAILAVLVGVAVPSYQTLVASNAVRSAASEMHVSLIQARSEAVKRNAVVTLAPISSNWANGWTGKLSGGETLLERGAVRGASFSGAPTSVAYLATGRMRGVSPLRITVTSVRDSSQQRCVVIDLNGRPAVEGAAC